jgi:hypothetical protein
MEFKGQSKPRRREEGDARNAKWRALTPEQQLSDLKFRRGESKKQRDKIVTLLVRKVLEGK